MYYGEIKKCDIANGEGVRVSLFEGVRIIVRDVSMQILGILNTEANIQIRRKKRFWRRSRQVILMD